MERKSPRFIWVFAAIGIGLFCYAGAYFAVVSAPPPTLRARMPGKPGTIPFSPMRPQYRIGADFSRAFFRPIHLLDRNIRDDYWRDYGVAREFNSAFKLTCLALAPEYDDPAVAVLASNLSELIHTSSAAYPSLELKSTVNALEADLQHAMQNSTKRSRVELNAVVR